MKVYKCDICGENINPKWETTIQHWFTKFDICYNCWSKFMKFKKLNKKRKRGSQWNSKHF